MLEKFMGLPGALGRAVVLLLCAVVGSRVAGGGKDYELFYGNVLSSDGALSDDERSLIVKALYYSQDQKTVYSTYYTASKQCYEKKLELGAVYSVYLNCFSSHHHLTVTQDLHSNLHLNQHTVHRSDSQLNPVSVPDCSQPGWSMLQYSHWESSSSLVCAATDTSDSEPTVKVATYNIWNTNEVDGLSAKERTSKIGKLLVDSGVDIVGLQEVRLVSRGSGVTPQSQVKILRKVMAGYQHVWQPAMLLPESGKFAEEGLAIFSRHPIISTDYILLKRNLTDLQDGHQRICLRALISTPVGLINVFVTHLSLSKAARKRSVKEIWRYVSSTSGVSVVMGDFNDEPLSTAVRFMTGEVGLEGYRTHGLIDVWDLMGHGNGLTFSTLEEQLNKRIDFMFLRDTSGALCVEDVSLLEHNSGQRLSDHLGVVTELKMKID